MSTTQETRDVDKARSFGLDARLVLLAVWLICSAYVATNLRRGWVPHDEGTYASCAQHVLRGELPHRDFFDLYGGGLAILHAAAFRILGINLFSMRIVLFVFFLASVPATFWIARRFVNPLTAGAVTLLACAWGVPNYSAPEPSWYNLFFAIFGTAALLKHIETNSRRWLFVSGLCAGLSILVKITGLYFVAGALLFFVFREQAQGRPQRDAARGTRRYTLFIIASLFLFVGVLTRAIQDTVPFIYHFVLPGACLAMFLLLKEVRLPARPDGPRFIFLGRMLMPFGAGLILPIVVFLVPYILSGSVPALLRGWFVQPLGHLSFFVLRPHGEVLPVLLLALVICIGTYLRGGARIVYSVLIGAGLIVLLKVSVNSPEIYKLAWRSASLSIPATVLCGVWLLHRMKGEEEQCNVRRQQLMLMLGVTAMCSLIQFPFPAPIYFCYVASLWLLALAAFFGSIKESPRLLLGFLLGFFLLFAVLRVKPTFIYFMGVQYRADTQTQALLLPRAGGLRVDAADTNLYNSLIPLVQKHSLGEFIYAAPDCPEVYFLSGLRNPTGTLFDFFDDPDHRTARILKTIDARAVNVVVLNNSPSFSMPMVPELRAVLTDRFPNAAKVGHFEVRWK